MRVTNCLYCGNKKLTYITHRIDNNGILKCSRCKVMMVENISDNTESLYTSEYFEKAEDNKSGYTNYLSSPVANLIGKYAFSRLFAKNLGNHLDLGCADGSLIEIFGSEGFNSKGLEISKDAVRIARAKGLDVSFSTLASFPRDLVKSDIITAFDLLEHADKPGNVLKAVYKNLEDNGYFVFSTLSVKKNDPSDYWFNNSLEHYVYYNQESLSFILGEVFGEKNFGFVEMEINGIAEFWGFAKKGKVTNEHKLISMIAQGQFEKSKPEDAYLLSLFYNQVSKFADSKRIIKYFENKWPENLVILAKFYNHYYQGQLEIAVTESEKTKHLLSAMNSIYWQALSNAEEVLYHIRKEDTERQHNTEVMDLRSQVFKLRDQLNTLRNSRVIGKAIKAREKAGRAIPKIKKLPKYALGKMLPHNVKHKLVQTKEKIDHVRYLRATGRRLHNQIVEVSNEKWPLNKPILSVVIPYFNRHDTIDDTLSSLSSQTYQNFEIILVDDGSTDPESIEKLKAIAKAEPNIHVIYQKNGGVASARNTGISKAKGKYVICLDSDDMLEPTFIEKALLLLETHPDVAFFTTDRQDFGVLQDTYHYYPFNPVDLYKDNMVITAAAFRREAWEAAEGYKSGIGYEDWEYWLSMAEKGYWGRHLPETLFQYRTSMQSRYVEDKDMHWKNIRNIQSLHPGYVRKVKKVAKQKPNYNEIATAGTGLINLTKKDDYVRPDNKKPNILITIPWMTFGGAETLIYNYCREIKNSFNISYVTGLKSENEWEYKFREITSNIYHLANLFETPELQLEFISNYIRTRDIDILHMVHNGFTFWMLPELKKRHPKLKIVLTLFNDRVPEYVKGAIEYQQYIDMYVSDNQAVKTSLSKKLKPAAGITVIPNGINVVDEFNPALFDRKKQRESLGILEDDKAIFFVGRLSEEKNPDVFLRVAIETLADETDQDTKFFVIGDGPMRREVENVVKRTNSNRLQYLGYQSKVAQYLAAGDIFVLPSKIEGFPLSILEAMAMQLVVVASDVGAVADVITDSSDGFVVTPGSDEEIRDIIQSLNKDKKRLTTLKANARKTVEAKYSNQALKTNYQGLYNKITKV